MNADCLVAVLCLFFLLTSGVGSHKSEDEAEEALEDYNYDDYTDEDLIDRFNNESALLTDTKGFLRITKGLVNVTKVSGDGVKLKCEATGEPPPVKFTWLKNEAPVDEEKNRLVIRRYNVKVKPEPGSTLGTRLKISQLTVHDTGFYTCIFRNSQGRTVQSTGVLKVRMGSAGRGLEIPQFPDFSAILETGEDLNVDGSQSSNGRTFQFPETDLSGHVSLPSDVNLPNIRKTTGLFNSEELQKKVKGTKIIPGTGNTFHPDLSDRLETKPEGVKASNGGTCEVYVGSRCSNYLANKRVYIPANMTQEGLEHKLNVAFSVIEHSQDLSKSCEKYAGPSLCYSAFAICKDNPMEPPRKICRNDCELLENELCQLEYALAKRHQLIGQQLKLPECTELPFESSRENDGCLELGIPKAVPPTSEAYCYWGSGSSYRGTQHRTAEGDPCIPWSHQYYVKVTEHPELRGHNYCRNPGSFMDQPWCYTDPQNMRRAVCDVPQCVSHMWFYVLAPTTGFVLLLLIWLIYYCCIRQKRAKDPRSPFASPKIATKTSPYNGKPANKSSSSSSSPPFGAHANVELNALLPSAKSGHPMTITKAREFPLSNVKFLAELGEGAFGKVYKGEVQVSKTEPIMQVAVKTLKENATFKTQYNFRREVDLMTELRHPNIICLLGIVVRNNAPYAMLFEYMSEGDLHEYLMAHSPRSADDPAGGHVLTQADFLNCALQIAAGMNYLSDHHYVHRDLAARNCLVGEALTVKISDFGLSRDVYSSDYYRVQSKSLLPVRWMPPESILYGKFTTESDVWSFGVLLWEIYSYGLQPYYGYNNSEVINMIRSRQLLPCPEDCPSRIYALMVECWHEVATRRPNFAELHARLNSWCMDSARVVNYSPNSHNPLWSNMDETSFRGTASSGSNKSSNNPSNNTGSTQVSMRQQQQQQRQQQPQPSVYSTNRSAKFWPSGSNSLPKSSTSSCSEQSSWNPGGSPQMIISMNSYHNPRNVFDSKISNI